MGATDHSGLNNVGLLITTYGEVLSTGTDPVYGPYAVIHDGSPGPLGTSELRVYTSEAVTPGEFRIFTGMVGLCQDSASKVRGAVYVYSGGQP